MSITDAPAPSALSSHARSKAFRASIEAKGAALRAARDKQADVAQAVALAAAIVPPIPTFIVVGLPDFFESGGLLVPKIEEIKRVVAVHFGVTVVDLVSARRTKDIIHPRQIAMYLCKRLTGRSLPEIGRRLGGKDHTTILHACRKVDRLRMEGHPDRAKTEGEIIAICSALRADVPDAADPGPDTRACLGRPPRRDRIERLADEGLDTHSIARRLRISEADVAKRLNAIRGARHAG